MKTIKHITNWLETHLCSPAYGGWVLIGITICFFAAAINTMTGWLYVMSGVSLSLLGVSAFLPPRSLAPLIVSRSAIQPTTVGNDLTIELEIYNPTNKPANLLQIRDILPFILGKSIHKAIETIPPGETCCWVYYHPTQRRGVYHWHTVELATGAPLGLFWCRRLRPVAATATVYPLVLPLKACPVLDDMGQDNNHRGDYYGRLVQTATEGLTRSLRPYRAGDPMRLIHWRTSARYGEFRVRDLETVTIGQEIIIALDTTSRWEAEDFEQAVIAAASLYFYAHRQQMPVQLWTELTGLVKGDQVILSTLAAINFGENDAKIHLPNYPLIWLTQNPLTISSLPQGSRWLVWQNTSASAQRVIFNKDFPGVFIDSSQPLLNQLQQPVKYPAA